MNKGALNMLKHVKYFMYLGLYKIEGPGGADRGEKGSATRPR